MNNNFNHYVGTFNSLYLASEWSEKATTMYALKKKKNFVIAFLNRKIVVNKFYVIYILIVIDYKFYANCILFELPIIIIQWLSRKLEKR